MQVFSPGRSPRGSPKPVAACVRGRGLLGSDQKHLQPLPAPGSLRPRQPAGSAVGSGWWPGPPCPGAAAHQLTLFAFKLVVKLSCGTIRPEKPKECAGPGFLFGERLSVNSAGIPAGSVGWVQTLPQPALCLAAPFVPANYLQDSPGQLSPPGVLPALLASLAVSQMAEPRCREWLPRPPGTQV